MHTIILAFLDIAPGPRGVAGIAAAVACFLVFSGAAFLVFKMLRRSVQMAFRVGIVAIILAIGITGSAALWAFSSDDRDRTRPTRRR